MNYKKAIELLVAKRQNLLLQAERIYSSLLNDKEFYSVETRLRCLILDEAQGKNVDSRDIAQLENQKQAILSRLGITDDMLHPPFICEKCSDTGFVNGKLCSCIINSASEEDAFKRIPFSQSDLSIFPETERPRINDAYEKAKKFCEKFPNTNKINLILMGTCGSGKTFLASCIASELQERGFSVVMLSAFAFVNRMLKYHTTFDENKLAQLEPLLDCDLLVIDDLGTETMLKNVTKEYLFHVINERMNMRKQTVITTNLDNELIRQRYGERLDSRLFGNKLSSGLALSNADLRKS